MSVRNYLHADNKGIRFLVLQNTFWLGASEAVSRGLWLLLLIWAARIFSPADFGKLAIAFSFVSLITIVADFGLTHIGIREFSKDSGNEEDFSSFFTLRLVFFLIAFLVIIMGSAVFIDDGETRMLCWVFGVFSLAREFPKSVFTLLRARQVMHFEAMLRIGQAILIGIAGFFALALGREVLFFAQISAISSVITSMGILVWFFLRVHPFKLVWRREVLKKFLVPSLSAGAAMAFAGVYIHTDTVMLGIWKGEHVAGVYGAAYRIAGIPMLVLTFLSMGFYPALGKAFSQSRESFQHILRFCWPIILLCVVPIGVGGVILASPLTGLFYGEDYQAGAPVLQLLFIMVVLAFLANIFSMAFLIARKEHLYTLAAGAAALANVSLNILLIPRFGMMGAAASTVFAYALLLGLQAFLSLRLGLFDHVLWHSGMLRLVLFLLTAGAGMAGGILLGLANGLHPFAVGLLALLVYCGIILIGWKKQMVQFS